MSASNAAPSNGPSGRLSLADGFEFHLSASPMDYERVLKEGLVALDTNAVLNLYRYTDTARQELFGVLRSLGERLWIPHQVAVEFWRNRESAASDLDFFGNTVIEELQDFRNQIEQSLRTWANRVALSHEDLNQILNDFKPAFDGASSRVHEFAGERSEGRSRNTFEDPVLLELQEVLSGKIGIPMTSKVYEEAVAEGLRRVDERVPPGYKDKKKGDNGAAGDYLVWAQILHEAKLRRSEVLLITGDVKEDWWRRESGEIRGPRLELSQEFHAAVGSRLFMLRPPRFLELAREVLHATVANETISDANRVELNTYALSERMDTASGILASLRNDILAYVENEPRRSLFDEDLELVEEIPAVIALFHNENLAYLGFGRPAGHRLRRFRKKLSGRQNISPQDVQFTIAPASVDQMDDRVLIQGMVSERRPPWNMNGFGVIEAGRLRARARLAENHFDMLYPIDISFTTDRLATAETVKQLATSLIENVPYRIYIGEMIREVGDTPVDKSALDGTVKTALHALANSLPDYWQISVMPGAITVEPMLFDAPEAQLVLRGYLHP